MKENIKLSINIEPLNKINPLISRFKCNVAAVDVKANTYLFHKDILEKIIPTLKGSPILTYYSEIDDKFAGHEGDYYISEKKRRMVQTPELYGIGFVDYVTEPFFETIKNEEWLTCICYLWDGRYSFLQNLSERKDIWQSMEIAVDYDELSDGTKVVTDAALLGLALIGIDPAFTGSTFEKFSNNNVQSQLDSLKQEYESFRKKYETLDFTISNKVKESAKLGLDLYAKYNKGGTSVSLANARYIQKNDKITPEKVRSIFKNCSRIMNKEFDKDNESDSTWISFNLWGATEGYKWSKNIVESMEKIDEEKMSYFSNNNTNSVFIDNINLTSNENNEEGDKVIGEAVEKFSLTARQIDEILNNALSEYKYQCGDYEYHKYWVRTFDAELVYVCDYEDNKTYSFKYSINENVATIDMESKDEVIDGGFMSVNKKDNSEESATENMSEDDKKDSDDDESKEENLSSNANVDNNAMQELNDKAADENKELSEEQMKEENDKDKIIAGMTEELSAIKEEMSKIKADMAVYMDENTKLKEFKANIEKQNKEFEVEMTLKEVMSVLPSEEIDACRMSSENFGLENIDAWKNEVQAKAFKFSKGITEKKSFTKIGLPYSEKPVKGKGLWD